MEAITVKQISSKQDKKFFIHFPWSIYRNDPHWVPPLLMDMRERLNEQKNPAFKHTKVAFFLAYKESRVVGRISASIDENFVRHQGRKAGHFGFFEAENDPDVASALLESAEDWLRQEGMESVIGPAAYGGNDDNYGCLIEGFEQPVFMHAYNPPYYSQLIENAGYAKARQLWAYFLDADKAQAPEQIITYAKYLEEKEGVTFRRIDMKNLQRDLAFWLKIYNSAWSDNWGFAPLDEEVFQEHAKLLRLIIDPDLAIFCEVNSKPAGASLTIPNFNEALAKINGRLFPIGALKLLYQVKRRKINGCRVFTLGVDKEFRKMGIGAAFYVRILEAARKAGYRWGDMSWILDNNDNMNKAIQAMGGKIWRRWQMYEKSLTA